MKNLFILLGLFTIIIGGCGQPNTKANFKTVPKNIWYNKGDYYLVKSFDTSGVLYCEQKFTMDSILNGATIKHYINGNVKKWYWYSKHITHEMAIVWYDSTGHFVRFGGEPFIGAEVENNSLFIEMINPPSNNKIDFVLGYKDSINNKEVMKLYLSPISTDSTAWVAIPQHKYKKRHKYTLWYLAINPITKQTIDSISTVLHNDADTLIYAPDY